ncbi:MAG: hypothetical protein A2V65_07675 [Deltaproteobacteria bacterium RBG_13_49_15]|nr:MAG: hypothetical protein A2V65_07675 [Deltaproteobacteria bacterium RBG_13_49_15]
MEKQKKPFVVSCGILKDEMQELIKTGQLDVDMRYLGTGLHYNYEHLKNALDSALQDASGNQRGKGIVIYGDVCMGFDQQIKDLVNKHGFVKVDALNCIDCLLGGKGELLKLDPNHRAFFLTPGWIRFWERLERSKEDLRNRYSMLDGLMILDSLGNLDELKDKIEEISRHTGLQVIKRKEVGLEGLRHVVEEAIRRLSP